MITELNPLLNKYNEKFILELERFLINSNLDKNQRENLISILLEADLSTIDNAV